jgi:hypothetical protein
MDERDYAEKLAKHVLDTPDRDPDDNMSVLSRQLLRALEPDKPDKPREQIVQAIVQALRGMERVAEKDGSKWVDDDDINMLALRLETDPTWP